MYMGEGSATEQTRFRAVTTPANTSAFGAAAVPYNDGHDLG